MIQVLIIDDEPDAIESLSVLLNEFVEGVQILGTALGVKSGVALIQKTNPQLVFLDINMKDGTGFDLLNQFENIPFQVIFITAYDQYAIKAFKYAAIDYLLKPLDLQELRHSVQRVHKLLQKDSSNNYQFLKSIYRNPLPAKLALPDLEGFELVLINEIIRCEGQNNYTTFFMEDRRKVIVSTTLKEYENILQPHGFLRVFQSHLINPKHIQRYLKGRGGTVIMSDGAYVSVSRDKKEALMKVLKQ